MGQLRRKRFRLVPGIVVEGLAQFLLGLNELLQVRLLSNVVERGIFCPWLVVGLLD